MGVIFQLRQDDDAIPRNRGTLNWELEFGFDNKHYLDCHKYAFF